MYTVGEKINTFYINPPIAKEDQYVIGEEKKIVDLDTREVLATFIVDYTDDTNVVGTINWVK